MRKIGIIILLFLCLTSLLLSGCGVNTVIPETAIGNLGNQEPTEEPGTASPQKWSGLTGFTTCYGDVEGFADIWLANGFTETRDLKDYQDTIIVTGSLYDTCCFLTLDKLVTQ